METYKQDSEVYQWELDLFDNHIVPNSLHPRVPSEQNSSYYEDIFIREDEEPTQVSIFTENLFRPYTRDYTLGIEDEEEDAQHNEPSSSCSSPGTNFHGLECSVEVSNEFSTIDGEIDRRFDQMVPIPHVPRINGEIPSVDEACFDHHRLIDRLQLYGLVEHKVEGDGNCQFRALSDQLYGTPEHHKLVRHRIVDQLRSHPEFYKEYVPMAYSDYLKKISKSGEWGDHVTLQAATDKFGCKIVVITSFKDTCYIEILPRDQNPNRVLFLSFWAEVHYNSIYPEGGSKNNMSSNSSAIVATEQAKTSYIWIQTKNGPIQQVEEEFSAVFPMIRLEMFRTGKGSSKNNPIHLPEQVSPAMLSLILHYWRFHLIPGHSNKEWRSFDEKFVKPYTDCSLELVSAAHALRLRPLVDLTSQTIARRIEGCSNDEIREIFHVPDDLTEEEKLEPLKNPTNNPYIRLLNKNLARKRKSWKEQNELKNMNLVNKQEDTRPIEELLEFINGKDEVLKCPRTCKSKKKNRRRKNEAQNSSVNDLDMTDRQDSTTIPSNDDLYSEGDLDQEKMRENDRIVAEFARKLNVVDDY